VALSATALVPQIRETITQRISTLSNLRADQSGEERLNQYRALTRDEGLIAGEGLGQIGVARRLGGMHRVILDSALIEIWRGLGVIAGTLYLGAMAYLVAALFQRAPDVAPHLHFDRAVVIAAWVQLPMGSVHTGENGFFAWLFLGLGLSVLAMSASP
jgi:heme exporter protein D